MSASTVAPVRPRQVRRGRLEKYGRAILLSIIAVPWIGVPLWLLLVNAAKPLEEANLLGLGLPQEWALAENVSAVIERGNYFAALTNSVLVAIPTIITVILLGSMAAWAYARSRSRTMKAAYTLTVLSILLPPAIMPSIFLLQTLGLDGSRLGYFLIMTATRLGIVVFLATGFIRGMPADLEEAASLDGATKLGIYRRVIFPLVMPVILVGSIILIITIWNEYFFASFMLRGADSATLPLALVQFSAQAGAADFISYRWNLIFAHIVLSSLPLLLFYIVLQRRIVGGLSEGALKG